MQGVWYTDPCKHKIFFVRFCAALHVSPALHRTSAGAFACPYPKSVLCCKGRQRMERKPLVFILTFWRRDRPLRLETAGGVCAFIKQGAPGGELLKSQKLAGICPVARSRTVVTTLPITRFPFFSTCTGSNSDI